MKTHETPTTDPSLPSGEAPLGPGSGSNPGGDYIYRQFKMGEQTFPTTDEERLSLSNEKLVVARDGYTGLLAKRRTRSWSPRYKKKLTLAKEDYEITRDNNRSMHNDIKRRSLYGPNVNKDDIEDQIVEDNLKSSLNEVELLSANTWGATLRNDRKSIVGKFANWWDRRYQQFFDVGIGLEEVGLNAAVGFLMGFLANTRKDSPVSPIRGGLSGAKTYALESLKNVKVVPREDRSQREQNRNQRAVERAQGEARAIQEKVYKTYRTKRPKSTYAGRSVITSDFTDLFRENTHKIEKGNKWWALRTSLGLMAIDRTVSEQGEKGITDRIVEVGSS